MLKALEGTKVLVILPTTGFNDDELGPVKTTLETAGATLVYASASEGDVTSAGGVTIKVVSITEPRTTELLGAVVIGGLGTISLVDNGIVHKALRMIERDRKPIGALSQGVAVLARGGLLKGKRATIFMSPDMLKELKDGGAQYEKKPISMDGDLVTADGAASAERFAIVLRELLTTKRGPRPRG